MDRKEMLTFHSGIPSNDGNITTPESEKFTRKFVSDLGLKVFSGCWSTIDLSSPKVEEFIDKVKLHQKNGEADFVTTCFLNQSITEPSEWYQLASRNSDFDSISYTRYNNIQGFSIKAYKIPSNLNVFNFGHHQFVSEKFVNLVYKNNLKGIDFIWVKDTGKYKAKQWYIPVPSATLGRGIDHSWFDSSKLKGSDAWQSKDKNWRTGVFNFYDKQIHKNIDLGTTHNKILNIFSTSELIIHANHQYLREFLPNTDFAFNWKSEDVITKEGHIYKSRGLCLNDKTVSFLIENDIITKDDITPIQIVDSITDKRAILDVNKNYPSAFYTKDDLTALKGPIGKEFEEFKKQERPKKIIKFRESISLLRKVKKDRPEDFEKGTKGLEEILKEKFIPNEYREVLKITNGCHLDAECSLITKEEYYSFNEEKALIMEDLNPSFEKKLSYIGYSINGDWYAINNNQNSEEWGSVYRISHEDLSIEYKWSNLGELIYDIIDGFYD
ncbi:SMI1/KNR4 family protein [Algibacter sp. TI.3.09]|uniref:SMI1/KNR4 family protein n=1 Tax=Algibacter sp. TI.3.09 TaxID=3121298 RepID=UPI00311FEAAA